MEEGDEIDAMLHQTGGGGESLKSAIVECRIMSCTCKLNFFSF